MGIQNFEEMISFYHNLTVYCAIVALVFLVLSVFLFIKLNIPHVFAAWTGRVRKKAVNDMISDGTDSGSLSSSKVDEDGRRRHKSAKTGRLGSGRIRQNTGKISGNRVTNTVEAAIDKNKTDVHIEQKEPKYEFTYPAHNESNDTFGSEETDVLRTLQTAIDASESEALDILVEPVDYQPPISETMVLDQTMMESLNHEFVILRSIVEVHTNEIILG